MSEFFPLLQKNITHYLCSFHMLSTKKLSKQKKTITFSTLISCFPSSPISLSNKKMRDFCAKKCVILHYLPLITQRHAKKIMRLNAIFLSPCHPGSLIHQSPSRRRHVIIFITQIFSRRTFCFLSSSCLFSLPSYVFSFCWVFMLRFVSFILLFSPHNSLL